MNIYIYKYTNAYKNVNKKLQYDYLNKDADLK